MLKNLILVGTGDCAREVFSWASPFFLSMGYNFKGFLGDDTSIGLAEIEDYVPQENDVFACTIGTPSVKRKLVGILISKGAKFVNIIHPSALILSDLSAYSGLVIAPSVHIANNVILADYILINVRATLGHDVIVGEYTTIGPHGNLTGHVKVGKEVFVGSSACIIPRKIVGDNAVIGAGSAVMRNVPAGITVVGVPAKRLT